MCRSHPRAWSPRALDIAAAQLSLRIGLRGESGRVAWAAFFDGIPVSTAVWVESAGSAMCAAAELPGPCCPRACPRRARPTLVHARAGPVGVLCVAAHLINSFFMCAPRDRVRAAPRGFEPPSPSAVRVRARALPRGVRARGPAPRAVRAGRPRRRVTDCAARNVESRIYLYTNLRCTVSARASAPTCPVCAPPARCVRGRCFYAASPRLPGFLQNTTDEGDAPPPVTVATAGVVTDAGPASRRRPAPVALAGVQCELLGALPKRANGLLGWLANARGASGLRPSEGGSSGARGSGVWPGNRPYSRLAHASSRAPRLTAIAQRRRRSKVARVAGMRTRDPSVRAVADSSSNRTMAESHRLASSGSGLRGDVHATSSIAGSCLPAASAAAGGAATAAAASPGRAVASCSDGGASSRSVAWAASASPSAMCMAALCAAGLLGLGVAVASAAATLKSDGRPQRMSVAGSRSTPAGRDACRCRSLSISCSSDHVVAYLMWIMRSSRRSSS